MKTSMCLGAFASLFLVAGAAHAGGGAYKTTNNNGLSVSVSDKVGKVSGPNEAALAAQINSSFKVAVPASSPLAQAKTLKMYVGMKTTMSVNENEGGHQFTQTTTGPSANTFVTLTKNAKTGQFVGKGSMGLVWQENFGNVKTVRRDVALTDGTHWYSDFGNNITIAPAPVVAPEAAIAP